MLSPLDARKGVLSGGLAVLLWTLLAAQMFPLRAGETPIASAIPGDQDFPAVALNEGGGYVVWEDNRIEGGKYRSGIAALALDANLTATGSVFRVNHQPTGSQEKPQLLSLPGGGTLFAWESRQGGKPGAFARLLGPDGRFVTGDVQLNTPAWTDKFRRSTNWLSIRRNSEKFRKYKFRETVRHVRELAGGISLAPLPDGGAVAAFHAARRVETNTYGLVRNPPYWTGSRYLTNDYLRRQLFIGDWMLDVFFQRLDAEGRKVGPEVQVNQYANFNQRAPAVAVLAGGNLVVCWVSEFPQSTDWRQNFRVELMARLFNPQGEPLGDEFRLSPPDEILVQANPVIAPSPGGGFTAYWSQHESASSRAWDVYARSFGADGTATGPAFRVNDVTTGDQFGPKVAAQGDRQLVVWTSVGQDGSREGVYGRWLAAGALDGDEFRVNTTTAARQHHPAVATDGQGRFMAVWSGFVGQPGFDLFGEQYYAAPAGEVAAAGYEAMGHNRAVNYLRYAQAGKPRPPLPPTPLTPADAPSLQPGSPPLPSER